MLATRTGKTELVADPKEVIASYGPWWAVRGRWGRARGDEPLAVQSFGEAVAADPLDVECACQSTDPAAGFKAIQWEVAYSNNSSFVSATYNCTDPSGINFPAESETQPVESPLIPGVNNLGTFGRWAFEEFTDVFEIEAAFGRLIRDMTAEKVEA